MVIEFVDQYVKLPEEKFSFECKICKNTFHSVIGKIGNLNKHLKAHESLDDWHKNILPTLTAEKIRLLTIGREIW